MIRTFFALLTAIALNTPVWANQALAQKKNCLSCHTIERKVVGPAYKDIARRYAGQDVSAKLAAKIRQGGAGTWGSIPMPANPQLSDAEARQLAAWVMSLK